MTDREKAIVMAYTGICMLEGEKINEFYKYLAEIYGRPIYTHELVALDTQKKSKEDFIKLCRGETPEVIHCKDCIDWDSETRTCMSLNWNGEVTPAGMYCGWAERRADVPKSN